MLARVPTLVYRDRFKIGPQTIAPTSTYTETRTLPRSDFERGVLLLGVPNSVTTTTNRRRTALVQFATAAADGASQVTFHRRTTFNNHYGCSQTFTNWQFRAYFHSTDGRLSANQLQAAGIRVRLNRVQIIGATVEIEFENTHVSNTSTVELDAMFRVWRTALR